MNESLDPPRAPLRLRSFKFGVLSLLALYVWLLARGATARAAEDASTAAAAINQFGLELHRQIATADANSCTSPYSVESGMAMLYAGADGETHAEIAKVLHFPDDDGAARESFAALAREFAASIKASTVPPKFLENAGKPLQPIDFTVTNSLFAQQGFPFEASYLDLLARFYHAPLVPVDFRGNPDGAAGQINAWTNSATHGRIRGSIMRGALDSNTRMVLSNTLYFAAHWECEFDPKMTKPERFQVRGRELKFTRMMQMKWGFGFREGGGYSAITIRYAGEEFQFLILLPNKPTGLHDLESQLSAEDLSKFAKLPVESIRLHLPRFQFDTPAFSLKGNLRALGLKTAFDDPPGSANFGEIAARTPTDYLGVQDIFHGTALTVNEQGTIAAALTQGPSSTFGAPAEIWVDRPFFFAVQHVPTGACILVGHVVDPREPTVRDK